MNQEPTDGRPRLWTPRQGLSLPGMSRRRMLGLSLGAGAAVLAGCGSDGDGDGDGRATEQDGGADASSTAAPGEAGAGQPLAGGRLRLGISNGGPSDTLDPVRAASFADLLRIAALHAGLTRVGADLTPELELAEEIEGSPDAMTWTIRLRPGTTFHDGSPVTLDDVIFTFQRVKDNQNVGRSAMEVVDFDGLRKVDDRTLEVALLSPRGTWLSDLAQVQIVKAGATDDSFVAEPIGAGPFRFVSFTPGQTSLFERHDGWFESGRPYLDEIELTTIADPTARINALVSGQVDAVESGYTQAREYADNGDVVVNVSPAGQWLPFTMAADTAPFDDVRVRQAMRLIVDRQAMVDAAQFGFGEIGNDLWGKGLPDYNDELPQRTQDLDMARALLREAGAENLAVTLDSSPVVPGMLEAATLFAEQASGAGVEVTINNIPPGDFFGARYLQYTFSQSSWVAGTVLGLMDASVGPNAIYNETHFVDAELNDLVAQAQATVSADTRKDLVLECQRILHERGGYVIWGLAPYVDALSPAVQGMESTPTLPLGGGNFRDVWMSA
jgi:peptide/nickel transport system substrate-binding protein